MRALAGPILLSLCLVSLPTTRAPRPACCAQTAGGADRARAPSGLSTADEIRVEPGRVRPGAVRRVHAMDPCGYHVWCGYREP